MKNNLKLLLGVGLFISSLASAQVGIGNTDPKATLDVNKVSYTSGEKAGIAVTQLTGAQIEAMTTTDLKSGTLLYATSTSGAINDVGYWFYNGTRWIKIAESGMIPKLTNLERDALVSPATGFILINTTSVDLQVNLGTPTTPVWGLASNFVSEYRAATKYAMGFDTNGGGYFSSGNINYSGSGPSGWKYSSTNQIMTQGGYVFSDGGTFNLTTFLPATAVGQNAIIAKQNAFVVNNSGNIGVGTASPTQLVDVRGNIFVNRDNSAFAIDDISFARLGLVKRAGSGPVIASDSNNPIIFSQSNKVGLFTDLATTATFTERMRIATNGNVGVGTIAPAVKLQVNGVIRIGNETVTTPAAGMIRFNATNSKFEGYDGTTWQPLN